MMTLGPASLERLAQNLGGAHEGNEGERLTPAAPSAIDDPGLSRP